MRKEDLLAGTPQRNVSGRYAKAIADGISHSKVFVLILNERSAVSEAVLSEVEIAHNISKSSNYANIQPLCIQKFDLSAIEFQEMMYYIRRFQFIYTEISLEVEKIADSIIKSQTVLLEKSHERKNSGYVVQSIED